MSPQEARLIRLSATARIDVWSYELSRPSPSVSFVPLGIEIGVVLAGERWRASSDGADAVRLPRGTVSMANLGVPYQTRYLTANGQAREIGLTVRVGETPARSEDERLLFFPSPVAVDRALVGLAEHIAYAMRVGGPLPVRDIETELTRFVATHAELRPADPLERARLELHRHFERPLYMRHFAEVAGVHSATFARKFAARYGMTPARYRTLLRLSEAAILLATRPRMTVRESAARVGFEDVPYFHRAFAACFGRPPLALARVLSAA
jgi:AraC-like DNA-binding protein